MRWKKASPLLPPTRWRRRSGGLTAGAWRWIGSAALIALAIALPFLLSNYHVFELTMVLIYAIAVLGLNILTGYNGQISLGHGGFFAAGAYTAAILMHRYGVPYWATLAAGRIDLLCARRAFRTAGLALRRALSGARHTWRWRWRRRNC